MLLPSVLSEAAPNYSRTLPSLPAVFVAAGLGLTWIVTYRWPVRWLGPAMAGSILIFSLGSTIQDYFVRFAQRAEVYYLYDADKLDALDHLAQFTDDNTVYISQLWGEKHATVYLLRGRSASNRSTSATRSCCRRRALAPSMVFRPSNTSRAQRLADLWPEAGIETVMDHFDHPLITVVQCRQPRLKAGPIHSAQRRDAPKTRPIFRSADAAGLAKI